MAWSLALPEGGRVFEVGCGRGVALPVLARLLRPRRLVGVDVDRSLLELARSRCGVPAGVVELRLADVRALPFADASFDLVWCRDVLTLVEDLDAAARELRRVLRPEGRALVYLMLSRTREGDEVVRALDGFPASADESNVERALTSAGFSIDERIEIGSEWGEHAEETVGKPGKRLLWAARLLRDPERYVARFGRAHYETMLADCRWHVLAMTGGLHRRAYLLTAR